MPIRGKLNMLEPAGSSPSLNYVAKCLAGEKSDRYDPYGIVQCRWCPRFCPNKTGASQHPRCDTVFGRSSMRTYGGTMNDISATGTSGNDKPSFIPLIDDLPNENPELGYERYSDTLASVIKGSTDPEHILDNTPLTVGLFAPWGSGKSTLLNNLKDRISADPNSIVVSFNAWHHAKSADFASDLSAAMIQSIDALEQDDSEEPGKGKKAWSAVKAVVRSIPGIAPVVAETAASVALGTVTGNAPEVTLAEVKGAFNDAIADESTQSEDKKTLTRLRNSLPNSSVITQDQALDMLKELLKSKRKRMVIFIDDLDRCAPSSIASVIESISTLTGREGMIFVLALDHDYVVTALENHYRKLGGEIEGDRYLEKIIQLPFWIPLPEFSQNAQSLEAFLGSERWKLIQPEWIDEKFTRKNGNGSSDLELIIRQALRSNPRQIKRFINTYLLLSHMNWDELHTATKTGKQFEQAQGRRRFLLYLLGIQIAWPSLYTNILSDIDHMTTPSPTEGEEEEVPSEDNTEISFMNIPSVQTVLSNNDEKDDAASLDMQDYLENRVFQKVPIDQVKSLMKMASSGAGVPAESVDKDWSKWYWDNGTKSLSKIDLLKYIVARFWVQSKNRYKKDAFVRELAEVIRAATSSTVGADAELDEASILQPASEREPAIRFSDDRSSNGYTISWSCGFNNLRAVGRRVHRPVIEYFMEDLRYPIVNANGR